MFGMGKLFKGVGSGGNIPVGLDDVYDMDEVMRYVSHGVGPCEKVCVHLSRW